MTALRIGDRVIIRKDPYHASAGHIGAEMLEANSVVGFDVDLCMQGEAVLVCAESAGSPVEAVGIFRLLDQALDALAGVRAEGDAALDGCGGDEGEEGVLIGVTRRPGVLFASSRPEAAALEQAQDAGGDGVEEAGDVLLLEL